MPRSWPLSLTDSRGHPDAPPVAEAVHPVGELAGGGTSDGVGTLLGGSGLPQSSPVSPLLLQPCHGLVEVQAGRTALECLVTHIEGEWQLVLESLDETCQLWAPIDVAVVHECRVTKQHMASIPTPAAPAIVPQTPPSPPQPLGPFGTPGTRDRAQLRAGWLDDATMAIKCHRYCLPLFQARANLRWLPSGGVPTLLPRAVEPWAMSLWPLHMGWCGPVPRPGLGATGQPTPVPLLPVPLPPEFPQPLWTVSHSPGPHLHHFHCFLGQGGIVWGRVAVWVNGVGVVEDVV